MEKESSKETEEAKKPTKSRRETAARNVDDKEQASDAPVAEGKTKRDRGEAKKVDDAAGGWMTSSSAPKKVIVEDTDTLDENLNTANKDKHFSDDRVAGDILEIPDLEEDGMDGDRVAHAPRYVLRKIPTLAELEADVKSSVPKDEGGLDLSILLGVLVPKSQLEETDVAWTFDSLLTEVTDELAGTEKLVLNTILKEPKESSSKHASSSGNAGSGAGTSKSKSSSKDPSRR